MASQFAPLLRNEVAKAARRRIPYFGILIVGLLAVIIYFIAGQVSNAAAANAWGYSSFSMQIIFTDIGPIFVISFAARLMAEETGTGTIHSILAAPVHCWELYLAKAAMGLVYMVVLSVAALLISAALGTIHYQFGPVADSAGVIYSPAQALHQFLFACVLSWIPLSALVMYGLLISTLARNTGAATTIAISTLFIIEFSKHLVGLDPYIFTRYIDYPWLNTGLMAQGMDFQWQPEIWHMFELSGISAAIAFGAGLIVFTRQDLNH